MLRSKAVGDPFSASAWRLALRSRGTYGHVHTQTCEKQDSDPCHAMAAPTAPYCRLCPSFFASDMCRTLLACVLTFCPAAAVAVVPWRPLPVGSGCTCSWAAFNKLIQGGAYINQAGFAAVHLEHATRQPRDPSENEQAFPARVIRFK